MTNYEWSFCPNFFQVPVAVGKSLVLACAQIQILSLLSIPLLTTFRFEDNNGFEQRPVRTMGDGPV